MSEELIARALILKKGLEAKNAIQKLTQLPVSEILLFGSRAVDKERPTSDVDAVAFLEVKKLPQELTFGLRTPTSKADLDLDIKPSHFLNRVSKNRLYWRKGIALYDPQSRLRRYLERLNKLAQKPLRPLKKAEIDNWGIWLERMSARISENLVGNNEALANYQLSWLHQEILQLYCPLKRMHSLSPRELHEHLEATEPKIWEQIIKLNSAFNLEERNRILKTIAELLIKKSTR